MSVDGTPAIDVEGIWKQYIRYQVRAKGTALQGAAGMVKYPWRQLQRLRGRVDEADRFWAVRDVSFQVAQGEVMGLVGRNGAGKSTMLKILSRITEPTRGRGVLRGRVGSLLEVGTGFHPELTGRENVFLNAAILGMSKADVRARFDEIVAFAGVEAFLETPIKRYSSGMHMRLAFSVAAHLEPEILLVDEVLAVGDAEFQVRCIGKMGEVAGEGRTVVFVSHNMPAVAKLCDRVVWLDGGGVKEIGASEQVVRNYLASGAADALTWRAPKAAGSPFELIEVSVAPHDAPAEAGAGADALPADRPFDVSFRYRVTDRMPSGRLGLRITSPDGLTLLSSASTDHDTALRRSWGQGDFVEHATIPGHLLAPGRYFLSVSEPTREGSDVIHESILTFTIGEENSLSLRDGREGLFAPLLTWTREEAGSHA